MLTVLVTAAEGVDVSRAARRLVTAGHRVTYCHPRSAATPAPACAALASGESCPLETTTADVVVAVCDDDHAACWHELGVLCALRQGIPLVVCGPVDVSRPPWDEADAHCDLAGLPAACAAAISPTGRAARRAVTRAVRRELTHANQTPAVGVRLGERAGTLQVVLTTTTLPPRVRERVRGAVRAALAPYTQRWESAGVLFLDLGKADTASARRSHARVNGPEPAAPAAARLAGAADQAERRVR